MWATLTLPLAFAVRSDIVWTPWVIVSAFALTLWLQTYSEHHWFFEEVHQNSAITYIAWTAAIALCALMSRLCAKWTDAGEWASRSSVLFTVSFISTFAIGALSHPNIGAGYYIAILIIAAACVVFSSMRNFDIFNLSTAAFAMIVLLVGGFTHALLAERANGSDLTGRVLLIGLFAAVLLGGAVVSILKEYRAYKRFARHQQTLTTEAKA